MARKRMINPDFWIDDKIALLSRDARLLFIGTWNVADDKGRLEASPQRLRAQIFPYDFDLDVVTLLGELTAHGLLLEYSHKAHDYYWIPNFLKHQKISNPTESRLPPHPNDEEFSSPTGGLQEGYSSPHPQGKGREGEDKVDEDRLSEWEGNSDADPFDEDPCLSILRDIKGYPFDLDTDSKLICTLQRQYPDLDAEQVVQEYATFVLDTPIKKSDKPRSRLNTFFRKRKEWGGGNGHTKQEDLNW